MLDLFNTRIGPGESIRVLTTTLPRGYRLRVGDDDDRNDALQKRVLRNFGWAFAGVVLLGLMGGWRLSHDVHRRLANMTGTAEAMIP